MTPLSRWKLKKEIEQQVFEALVKEFSRISSDQEMKSLIKILLTDTEMLMIGKRLLALTLIGNNKTDVEIARFLHLTRETVKRLRLRATIENKNINQEMSMYKELLNSDIVKKIFKEFIKYAIPAAMGRAPTGL
jgi:hypothetical protein